MPISSKGYDRLSFERAIADRLISMGKLDVAAAERAFRLRAAGRDRLEQILTALVLVAEKDVTLAVADELHLPLAGPADYPDVPILDAAGVKFLRQSRGLPLADTDGEIVLAMADPLVPAPVRSFELLAGKPVAVWVAMPSDLDAAYERLYGADQRLTGDIVDDVHDTPADEDIGRLRDMASEAPVIRLVNQLIARAVESRASDIHIEPFQGRLIVRYRIDGLLRDGPLPPQRLGAAIVSRVKIMAKLNIAERRL